MNLGFWAKLKRPFTVLAPMANVTDFAFRQIIIEAGRLRNTAASQSRPDVFYTEFLSCDGIMHDKTRFEKELYFEKSESPIVVQFFGSKPENFYKCAKLAQELGYDGIDINMGCPDKSVEKQGGGAALIKDPKLAQEIIKATQNGAGELPVSVKTRLGYNKVEIETWIPQILEAKPAVLIIHGRTRKEMSKVPANWELIGKVSEIVHSTSKETLIIGNGDIKNLNEARKKAEKYNLDGVMIGRGVFENPWLFNSKINSDNILPKQRIDLMLKHLDLFEKLWNYPPSAQTGGGGKNFDTLKKFFKIYINGWKGAKNLRIELMATKNGQDVKRVVDRYLAKDVL